MLVDSPLQPPSFAFPSSFEDFFNMDLVSSSSSSSSSPHSPQGSSSFPLTPPQQPSMLSFSSPYDPQVAGMGDPSEFLNMYLDDDYSKPIMMPPSSGAPYDFLGAFGSVTPSASITASPSQLSHSSPHDAFSSTTPGVSPQLGIDPSLMGIGSPADAFDDHGHDDEHDDEDEEAADTVSEIIAPIKVGGKGKARKGTVASGGIKKLAPASSSSSPSASSGKENVNKDAGSGGTVEDRESDDWRPSPEEYKKMSSKEKRQLRNKISARNFRVRRKEYISTLEADISERDSLISAIRSELGSSQSENVALRQEIAALKRSLLAGRRGIDGEEVGPVLPPPAPLSPVSVASASSSPSSTGTGVRAPSPLLTPNTQKDLPTSPRLGTRGFWGGVTGGGGYTPVHTTFVPPLSMVGVGVSSAVLARKGVQQHHQQGQQQENINPSLNDLPLPARVPSPPIANPSPFTISTTKVTNSSLGAGGVGAGVGGFDAFADMNPFTLKTLDAYRMQLWGKMAAQGQVYQQQQQQQQAQQQQYQQLSGLASGLRPQFFRDAHGLSGSLLSGKSSVLSPSSSSSSSYPTPPNTPPALPKSFTAGFAGRAADKEIQRDAMYAALASQTLLGKLGSAFWDAFSGGSTSASTSTSAGASSFGLNTAAEANAVGRQWDAEKVRKVLEGKAVVRVVDVVESNPSAKTAASASPKLSVAGSSAAAAKLPRAGEKTGEREKEREREKCIVTDILEGSMRGLSLGKK